MIKDGLIQYKEIGGIPVRVDIVLPKGLTNVRTLKAMEPKGITLHSTGNLSAAAGALQHGKYLQNLENSDSEYKSWHITVDSGLIVQHLPLTEQGWHAGDGASGYGNICTIGIEIAENKDYNLAESNGIQVINALMRHYGFSADNVQPHRRYSSTRKLCPRRILLSQDTWEEDWQAFQRRHLGEGFHLLEIGSEKQMLQKDEILNVVYKSLDDVPLWGRAVVEKLIHKGYLKGGGESLELTYEMLRILVINDRAGLY
jgi:hypothetical protein